MKTLQISPYMLEDDEGQRLQSLGASISVKATSMQTCGAFNLFEVSCPPDYETPLHIHYIEDVAVYILEGELSFFWGDEKKEALPGATFFQPRGTPHGFRVEGDAPARILYLTVPAGLDQFVIDQNLLDSKSDAEINAARYKIEILGPLPE